MDPVTINAIITAILGSASLLGDDEPQGRVPYNFNRDKRRLAGPEQSLYESLRSITNLGAGLQESQPFRLRSSFVPGAPGGLGEELPPEDLGEMKYQPFDRSLLQPKPQPARRRTPWHF